MALFLICIPTPIIPQVEWTSYCKAKNSLSFLLRFQTLLRHRISLPNKSLLYEELPSLPLPPKFNHCLISVYFHNSFLQDSSVIITANPSHPVDFSIHCSLNPSPTAPLKTFLSKLRKYLCSPFFIFHGLSTVPHQWWPFTFSLSSMMPIPTLFLPKLLTSCAIFHSLWH